MKTVLQREGSDTTPRLLNQWGRQLHQSLRLSFHRPGQCTIVLAALDAPEVAEGVRLFFEPPEKALALSDPKARFCDSVPRKLFDLPAVLRAPLCGEAKYALAVSVSGIMAPRRNYAPISTSNSQHSHASACGKESTRRGGDHERLIGWECDDPSRSTPGGRGRRMNKSNALRAMQPSCRDCELI